MNMTTCQDCPLEREIYFKLKEAEGEAELTRRRYSSKEVLEAMQEAVRGER